ncbi:hypothetical protein QYF36_015450 [Acer negundo]|nr:hypothetical protein QYF36_015450 [Acer negundo]
MHACMHLQKKNTSNARCLDEELAKPFIKSENHQSAQSFEKYSLTTSENYQSTMSLVTALGLKVFCLSVEMSKAMAKVTDNAVVEGIGMALARKIKLPEDSVVFSVASKKNSRLRASSVVPWLMLPPKEKGSDVWSFFSLSKGMSLHQINLPDDNFNKCFSSKGWLMVIYEDLSMYLLHPFSSLRIELPHIKTLHNWEALSTLDNAFQFIKKFVLSTGPSLESEDYTLVVIYGRTAKLAYFRPGFKTWITIDSCQQSYCDVTYYQGQFYFINGAGITVVDIKSDNTVVAKGVVADFPLELIPLDLRTRFYVVESAGKILVVARRFPAFVTPATYGTTGFRVVEVDLSRNKNEWSVVNNLGNIALFVFDNSNFKPNCIYFTDVWQDSYFSPDFPEGVGRDMGIYNLQDESIERIETRYNLQQCSSLYHPFNPPMWVEDSFQ